MTQNKNKEILKIFNTIRKYSLYQYDDIDPDNYISPQHFLRLFYSKYHPEIGTMDNFEKPQVTINSKGYGYIVFPPSSRFKDNYKEISKVSKSIVDLDEQAKGWVIDMRGNTGGAMDIFLLFITIFIPIKYQGTIFSLVKDDNDIIEHIGLYDNILYMRSKYSQYTHSFHLKDTIHRLTSKKQIYILVDNSTGSGSEYLCMVLKSFGAKICGSSENTRGILNLTVGYIIDDVLSIYFPNAFVYDKNNLKQDIYIKPDKEISPKYLLP